MEVLYSKKFLKNLSAIPSSRRKQIEDFVFNELPKINSVGEIGKAEKMHGYDGFYKIRFGDYRVGLFHNGKKVELKRVLNRKEIYRYFP